jgi:hypothetical protein
VTDISRKSVTNDWGGDHTPGMLSLGKRIIYFQDSFDRMVMPRFGKLLALDVCIER